MSTRSAPSKSSAAASDQRPPGLGTKTTLRRSRPSSTMALTPGSARPTTPHQCPAAEAADSMVSAKVRAPTPTGPAMQVVVPRCRPAPPKSGSNAGASGSRREEAVATGRTRSAKAAGSGGRAGVGDEANICSHSSQPLCSSLPSSGGAGR